MIFDLISHLLVMCSVRMLSFKSKFLMFSVHVMLKNTLTRVKKGVILSWKSVESDHSEISMLVMLM